jgi:hypothetical protein
MEFASPQPFLRLEIWDVSYIFGTFVYPCSAGRCFLVTTSHYLAKTVQQQKELNET